MMELLARAAPISPAVRRDLEFFDTAEVVGRWVWIEFTKKRPAEVTRVLAELGFHWNNVRKAWQHPCGLYCDRSLNFDPRRKYGSYFAAAVKAT